MHGLRVYGALIGASIRSQLQYRLSVLFNITGYFTIFWSEFIAIWILFRHFGSLAGWRMEEVLVCYGLAHLSHALAEFAVRGFDFLADLTRVGAYDRLLLRPVSTVVQLCGHEFALHRLGRLLQALIVLTIALIIIDEPILPIGVFLLVWALFGGACLFSGLYILQGAVGMKVLQNIEAFNIFTDGGPQMAQFPMSIYPSPLRGVFTFLIPLAGVVYYPALTFLRRGDGVPLSVGWITPVGGVIFCIVALSVYRQAEARYVSTGS